MLTKLKNRFRLFFGFTASETNGLLLLVPILALLVVAPSFVKQALTTDNSQSQLEDQKILKAWLEESKSKLKTNDGLSISPTYFNPNTINKDKWVELGFKEKIADRIINYRQKGGTFRVKEDLLKIYGINKKLATAYFDYIIIPKPKKKNKATTSSMKNVVEKLVAEKETAKFDLNLADTVQLQMVKGIGPVLSSRIVKYKEMLGGYTNIEQLKEVYGLDDEVYQRIVNHFGIFIKTIRQININQDSISILSKHPYLSYKTSRAIIKYRAQHGDYQSIDELKNIHTISDSLFIQIEPYLKVRATE